MLERSFVEMYETIVDDIKSKSNVTVLSDYEKGSKKELINFLKELLNKNEIKYESKNAAFCIYLTQFTEEELEHIKNVYDVFYRR